MPLISLGARERVFSDPFDDPDRWAVSETDAGLVTYSDGALAITLVEPGASATSTRMLSEAAPVVRVEVLTTIASGQGVVGVGCGTGSTDPGSIVGGIGTDDQWRVWQRSASGDTPLASGRLPAGLAVDGGDSVVITIECAVTDPDGGGRVGLWVEGRIVADVTATAAGGPWDRALVAAVVTEPALIAFFDDAVVDVGDRYAPEEGDPAVLDLLRLVPGPWRDACTARRPVGDAALVAGLVCAPAGSAVQAEFYRYSTPEAADAEFSRRTAAAPDSPQAGDCAIGPSMVTWSVPEAGRGRLACAENRDTLGGRLIVWTDETLGLLGLGVLTDGGYPELYDWWLEAVAGG